MVWFHLTVNSRKHSTAISVILWVDIIYSTTISVIIALVDFITRESSLIQDHKIMCKDY